LSPFDGSVLYIRTLVIEKPMHSISYNASNLIRSHRNTWATRQLIKPATTCYCARNDVVTPVVRNEDLLER